MNLSRMFETISSLRDITKDDILHAVGLETRRTTLEKVLPAVGFFAAGAVIGAGVAMLLTPMSGEELRGEISKKLTDVKDRVSEKVSNVREQVEGGVTEASREFSERGPTTTAGAAGTSVRRTNVPPTHHS